MEKKKQIKICGIRRSEDIQIINKLHPDYVGFVFATSKRQVSLEEVALLIPQLKGNILPIGVYVNQSIDFILQTVQIGIKGIQLHGDEDIDYIKSLKNTLDEKGFSKVLLWKALPIKDRKSLTSITDELVNLVDGLLLDTYSKDSHGGSGEVFNWDLLENLNCPIPIFLAGGLNANNLKKAFNVEVSGYDLSSGVEGTDGYKDSDKLKILFEVFKNSSK